MRLQRAIFAGMGRILAIDYGRKRCGVAVTDLLGISANPLPTQRTCDLEAFLTDYLGRESVDCIVVGYPRRLNGEDSESMQWIRPFLARLPKLFPGMRIEMCDERFTSTIAHRDMIASGMRKSRRQEKGLADSMAATIILTDYLNSLAMRR